MSLGKWILGGLGFTMAGPLGAIAGFLLGSLFDGSTRAASSIGSTDTDASRASRLTTTNDIRFSILVLMACTMRADGHVRRVELEHVKAYLRKMYAESEAKQALQILQKLLEKDIDAVAVAQQIAQYVNYSTRLEIVHILLDIAHADDDFSASEKALIEQITAQLHVSPADYQSILSQFQKGQDVNWAYKALEIEPQASNEDIKKAYRKMAMKYHPDKVAGAGPDVQQKATEKFRHINEAYNHLKSVRGL